MGITDAVRFTEKRNQRIVAEMVLRFQNHAWVQGNHCYDWTADGKSIFYLQIQDGFVQFVVC
jgi:hypothetical protein